MWWTPLTGEILIEAGAKITRELAEKADNAGVNLVELKLDDAHEGREPGRSRSSPTAVWMHRASSPLT